MVRNRSFFRSIDVPRACEGVLVAAVTVSRVVSKRPDQTTTQAPRPHAKKPARRGVRIGHFVEAQILEALEIDYIDESEVPRARGAGARAVVPSCPGLRQQCGGGAARRSAVPMEFLDSDPTKNARPWKTGLEVLTVADEDNHINKRDFKVPYVRCARARGPIPASP